MLFFARPGFNVNLSAMNTVSQATRAAEEKLTSVWGDIFSKIFLMTEADSVEALQANKRPPPGPAGSRTGPGLVFPSLSAIHGFSGK